MDKKTAKKNKIISDSIGLMYLNGYNGTSVKDITDAAGIPKGSFYNYFEGKEQYAIDAIDHYKAINNEVFKVLQDKTLAPLERIKMFYRIKIERAVEKGYNYGCFVGNLSEEVGGVYENISSTAEKFHQRKEDMIRDNLVEAREQGELSSSLDESVLAGVIVGSWQGALLRTKVAGEKKFLDGFYAVLEQELLK